MANSFPIVKPICKQEKINIMKGSRNNIYESGRSAKPGEKFIFTENAFKKIQETVGKRPAESGGILLGSREDYVVQKFVFDPSGSMSAGAYDPDVSFLNKVVKKEWAENKLAFLGFLHSHPRGALRLSGDWGNNTGDVGYMKGIFRAMPTLTKILVPIMFSSADGGPLTVIPYIAERGKEEDYFEGKIEIIKDRDYVPADPSKAKYEFDQSRLHGSVDVDLMSNAKVVCVGVGGANGICESLVRSGLRKLVLIDFDTVDSSNLTTQGFFIDDIGKPKVVALKDRLHRINPDIEVEVHCEDFLKLKQNVLDQVMDRSDLLLMMTDSFDAQAYGNIISLQYQVPCLFALMYERGRAAEITFNIPGVTPACHRCAVNARYKAYIQDGYKNEVTSAGSTNFHTGYLNNCIGMIALGILHNYTKGFEFSNWFGDRWNQNLVQLRITPFWQGGLFNEISARDGRQRFLDSIWQKITPDAPPQYETCPDCGGQGDLRDSFMIHQNMNQQERLYE
jgi:hypothetical protein